MLILFDGKERFLHNGISLNRALLLFLFFLLVLKPAYGQNSHTFVHGKETLDIINSGPFLLNSLPFEESNPPKDPKVKGFTYLNAPHFERQLENYEDYNGSYKNDEGDIFCTVELRYEKFVMCWIPDHIMEFEIVTNQYHLQIGSKRKTRVGDKIKKFKKKFKNSFKAGKAEGKLQIIMSTPMIWKYGDCYFPMLTLYYDKKGVITQMTLEDIHGCCTDLSATP